MNDATINTLKDISYKETFYRSSEDDIPKIFYSPVLSVAKLYQRAVGYFCVSSLSCIFDGLEGLLKNEGRIQLITSPQLTEEDVKQIESGYSEREKINFIEKTLLKSFNDLNDEEKKQLSLVAVLIKYEILDIKIAVQKKGIYHDKIGLVHDNDGNTILFSGSMNETRNGMTANSEHFDVLKSWDPHDRKKIEEEILFFEDTWNNNRSDVFSIKFPDAVKEKCLSFLPSQKEMEESQELIKISNYIRKQENIKNFYLPDYYEIRDYQEKAINSWKDNKYIGIFDMATGAGKTLTAIAALFNLFKHSRKRLGIIIICPYQHLVEQWVEDISNCGINPIIGYSTSRQRNWKKHLQQEITAFLSRGVDLFCFVSTNSTFVSKYVQNEISRLKEDVVLVVDEAHNIGANNYRNNLPSQIPYRLALSATVERHNDETGTNAIYEYFQKKCITYSLKNAIDSGMLTPYYYYPIVTYLNDDELDEYIELTSKIHRALIKKKDKTELSKQAKILLTKRARLVAGAESKISKLKEQILPYVQKKHILVYCGATNVNTPNSSDFDEKQIDVVTSLLGNELQMKVGRFTSQESAEERKSIRKIFSEGDNMQVLVAIRCLDEGVNIPNIKTAFILASSTNPKEYIQRRGRVLRKAEGKKYAEIYDFITIPNFKEGVFNDDLKKMTKGLIKRELIRIKEFSELAQNPSLGLDLLYELKHLYGISNDELSDVDGE